MSGKQVDMREENTCIGRERAETARYAAEQRKLEAEAQQLDRNRWRIVCTRMTTGAALFGAGAAFIKLLVSR